MSGHPHGSGLQYFGLKYRLIKPYLCSVIGEIGQLEVIAGRVTDMWLEKDKLGVAIKGRGKPQTVEKEFALVVNCSGPLGSIAASGDPLLNSLFQQGLARPDALDLGLEVDSASRICGVTEKTPPFGKYTALTACSGRSRISPTATVNICKRLSTRA